MSAPRKDYGCPLRIYRNPGDLDYTALPPRSGRSWERYRNRAGAWQAVWVHIWTFCDPTVSVDMAQPGPHLGRRIHWRDLPPAVQRALRNSFLSEYCPKEA